MSYHLLTEMNELSFAFESTLRLQLQHMRKEKDYLETRIVPVFKGNRAGLCSEQRGSRQKVFDRSFFVCPQGTATAFNA